MKRNRDAVALAASLQAAASAPLPLPVQTPEREPAAVMASTPPKASAPTPRKTAKVKLASDTFGITLRPDRELHNRYVLAAAERTRKEGRVISAQQIMLEVLETGLKVQK